MLYETKGAYSETPFFFKEVGMRFYSIEELCYLLKENIAGLEDSMMVPELCRYIERDLSLPDLGRELLELIRNKGSLASFVKLIFEYTGFLSREELRSVEAILRENSVMGVVERKKSCGDFYLTSGRQVLAIREYTQAIRSVRSSDDELLIASCHHNLGIAYAKLFYYDAAAEQFLRAYELNNNDESYIQYLTALRISTSREGYAELVREKELDVEMVLALEERLKRLGEESLGSEDFSLMKRAITELDKGDVAGYKKDSMTLIEKWKKAYRRSMEID